jgi:hypothetical protein
MMQPTAGGSGRWKGPAVDYMIPENPRDQPNTFGLRPISFDRAVSGPTESARSRCPVQPRRPHRRFWRQGVRTRRTEAVPTSTDGINPRAGPSHPPFQPPNHLLVHECRSEWSWLPNGRLSPLKGYRGQSVIRRRGRHARGSRGRTHGCGARRYLSQVRKSAGFVMFWWYKAATTVRG